MATFTAFGFSWEKRTGTLNGTRQDSTGVTFLSNGKIQIEPVGASGAGVKLLQSLGFGVYEVSITGRLDALNPNAFVGIWLFDDRANRPQNFELDYEFSQWGNQNDYMRVLLTVGNAAGSGTPEAQLRFPVRSFEKHKITLSYEAHVVRIKCDGWWEREQRWLNYGFLERFRTSASGATLRIGVNLLNGQYLPGSSIGNNRIVVDSVRFTPAYVPPANKGN